MVHEKKKSGDPDFDDKVPAGDHLTVVTAGDGKIIGRLDPALGPVTPEGAHLPQVSAEDLDTRPAPGEVAEVKSEVQSYTPEDTPHEEISMDEVVKAESTQTAGQSGDRAAAERSRQIAEPAPESSSPPAPATKPAPASTPKK